MADDFDLLLASSLAPGERLPDRRFVARVQGAIALDQQLAEERRSLAASLASQVAALLAVAAAVWLIGRAEPVGEWLTSSPAVALAILIAAFTAVVALFAARPERRDASRGVNPRGVAAARCRFAALMMLNGG